MNGRVRYRPGIAQLWAFPVLVIGCGLIGICMSAVLAIHQHSHAVGWHGLLRHCGQFTLGALVAWSVTARQEWVELRADEMIVRGAVTVTRRIPRSRVTAVEVRRWRGTRQIFVHHDGTHTRLPAPTPFLDRRFEPKFRVIMAWAAGHG